MATEGEEVMAIYCKHLHYVISRLSVHLQTHSVVNLVVGQRDVVLVDRIPVSSHIYINIIHCISPALTISSTQSSWSLFLSAQQSTSSNLLPCRRDCI